MNHPLHGVELTLIAWLAWLLVGTTVLWWVDDEDQTLFTWASDGPFSLLLVLWPVVWWRCKRRGA